MAKGEKSFKADSGKITCAQCGSDGKAGVSHWGMFCSNPECKISEEKEYPND
jgi:hypothetical protein